MNDDYVDIEFERCERCRKDRTMFYFFVPLILAIAGMICYKFQIF